MRTQSMAKDERGESTISTATMKVFEFEVESLMDKLEEFENRLSGPNKARDIKVRNEFQRYLTARLDRLDRLTAKCNRGQIYHLKKRFRTKLKPWLRDNSFALRGLEKPRGYPGDYLMMEMAYENITSVKGGLAGEFDRLFFSRYVSVINRKNTIVDILEDALREWRAARPINILSLAGGPCREFYDLALRKGAAKWKRRVGLSYLDYDAEAVAFVKKRLSGNSLFATVNFYQESLLNFRNTWDASTRSAFDLIYAIGIADYFPDIVLTEIMATSLSLLSVGGRLIIAHKDKAKFNFTLLNWICDWTFLRRSEEDVARLVSDAIAMVGNKIFQTKLERDQTGEIMFFTIERRS